MKIVVIDDEPTARSLIKNIVQRLEDDSVKVFEAANLPEGVALIKRVKPKLVLLDIEMPIQSGTEIFSYFNKDEIDFELVFCTAYSEYAVKAFEMNAVDYILKPIRPSRVLEVIEKVKKHYNQQEIQIRLQELRETLNSQKFRKIGLPVHDGIIFVSIDSIIRLEADGMYTTVFQSDGESIVVSKPLKFFSKLLEVGMPFYRPHRSHIINMHFIKQFIKRDGNYILLDNEHIVPLSKDKREEFLLLIAEL
ncbi:MAG: DNA-binding response regulator [Flavobacteriales bacterium]|nr:MAG: DNA-binding response regulator [Flavobacteriales bacterium]